jgi:signal peptidase II
VVLSKLQQKQLLTATLSILAILTVDQASKVWVKTHMQLYSDIEIFSWFKIYFTENPGMAFGIELFDTSILTLFRIVVVSLLGVYIFKLIRQSFNFGFVVCLSCILAGAIGNIIDCVCYGVIFDHSQGNVASFMPANGGYSTWLSGKVVDMLYFPLIRTTWPSWVPFWGGQDFIFFRPIFNIADSSICVSVFTLIIFYRQSLLAAFSSKPKKKDA